MQIRPDSLFAKHAERLAERAAVGKSSVNANDNPSDFFQLVSSGISNVNQMQLSANVEVERMLAGEDVQSAEVLTGLQKADMAFRLLVQVRNKLMQAFDEINNIRI